MPVWPDPETASLRLSLAQFAPQLRDEAANSARISELLRGASADLVLTPELSLTGYDLRDAAAEHARSEFAAHSFPHLTIAGAVESAGGLIYNVAILATPAATQVIHRKVYLPTYGMFDEGRYFGRGDRVEPFVLNGWRIGVLICVLIWLTRHAARACHTSPKTRPKPANRSSRSCRNALFADEPCCGWRCAFLHYLSKCSRAPAERMRLARSRWRTAHAIVSLRAMKRHASAV